MSTKEYVVTIPMPFTGESIVDGVLVNWLVKPGDEVSKGQHLAEIETEKSVWEFESPCDGRIVELRAEPGDVVDVKAPLLDILTEDENMQHLVGQEEAPSSGDSGESHDRAFSQVRSPSLSELRLSPRIKRLVKENSIGEAELLHLARTSADGRISAEDVLALVKSRSGNGKNGSHEQKVSYIAGIGTYVPSRVVDNTIFEKHFPDVPGSYIEKVTGISQRRWVTEERTSDMAYEAASEALRESGLKASDIDLIILATTTPDMPLPATACKVQQLLGCRNIPAFDLQAACSGWLYALSIAQAYVKGGTFKHVLAIAAETMSAFTDPTDRATAFLFGDGAGAAVVSSQSGGHVLGDITLKAESDGYDIIYRKAGGAVMPAHSMESQRDGFWVMDGGRMFRSAVASFSEVIETVAAADQLALEEITWFVPHQANERILKTVAQKIKAAPERFFSNIRNYGNTSAASIPLALKDIQRQGKARSGDKLLLCAVGAGLTSAGAVLTWQ